MKLPRRAAIPAAALLLLAASSVLIGPTAAIASGSSRADRPPTQTGAVSVQTITETADTLVFTTSQHRFDKGVDNQGWYNNTKDNRDSNDNYVVGDCCGTVGEYRNFLTFYLGRLQGRTAAAATLVLRRGTSNGGQAEPLALFDVSTGARRLNQNDRESLEIFRDLGSGTRYGTYRLSTTADPDSLVHLPLNSAAVNDINHARGGFFSIGGRLLDTRADHNLFEFTTGVGVQALVVQLAPTCTVTGTEGGDFLVGTDRADRICAGGGNDTVDARGGDDVVYGGDGKDFIIGRAGADQLNGGAGNDDIDALDGSGTDVVDGGPGYDVCRVDRGDRVTGCEIVTSAPSRLSSR